MADIVHKPGWLATLFPYYKAEHSPGGIGGAFGEEPNGREIPSFWEMWKYTQDDQPQWTWHCLPLLEVQANWTTFTMYWPGIAIYALVGQE